MEMFGMSNLEDRPSQDLFPNNVENADSTQRESCFMNAMNQVTCQFVDLQFFWSHQTLCRQMITYTIMQKKCYH